MLQCAACDNQSLFQLDSQSVGLIHPLAQIPDLLEPVYSETDAFLVQESQIKIDEIQLVTAACRPDFEIFKCNRNGFNSIKTSSFHFYQTAHFQFKPFLLSEELLDLYTFRFGQKKLVRSEPSRRMRKTQT